MYVIIGNFGNDSIALIEWVRQQQLSNLFVVSVDTGWAAHEWADRVNQAEVYLEKKHLRISA